jgi:hypothetical protein|tara:strand:+ start:580 stop:699 length:120 start_codon:yes stop_codon:yes gene_type:complete
MAGIFDSISTITVVLIALGLVGVIIYERTRIKQEKESSD